MLVHRQVKSASFVTLLAFVVTAAGLIWRAGCADTGWGSSVDTYRQLCYSDVGPLYIVRGFSAGIFPYLDSFKGRYLEYPVLTGLWMWVTAAVSEFTLHPLTAFVYLTWLISLALITLSARYLHRLHPEKALWFAASPAIFLTVGINWDAAAVLALIMGMYFHRKGKVALTGIAIGVGAAFKLFPVLLLLPILADSIRHRKLKFYPKLLIWTAGSWVAINLPFFAFNSTGWWEFYNFSRNRPVDFGSPWLALRYLFELNLPTATVNFYSSLIVAVVAVVLLLFSKRLDFFTVTFIFVATFALVNKVYSPQFVLWLTPLAVLTNIKFKEFVVWQLAQVIYYIAIWRHLMFVLDSSAPGGINNQIYGLAIAVQVLSTLGLVGISFLRGVKSKGFSGRLTG